MLHIINLRIERDVVRFEAPDSRILSTVASTMLTDGEGMILRAGMRPHEWERITEEADVAIPPQLRFVKPFDEPRDAAVVARFLHHVTYEFLQQIHDATGRGSWFTDRVALNVVSEEKLDESFVDDVFARLEKLPLFHSGTFNDAIRFEKGTSNRPAVRFLTIAGGAVLAIGLIVIPLFAIDAALDRHPGWRRAFLGTLALLTAGGTAAFLWHEKRQGNLGTRTLVFVAAIAALAVLRLLGGMMEE